MPIVMMRDNRGIPTFISETFLLACNENQNAPTTIRCRWRYVGNEKDSRFFRALDLRLRIIPAEETGPCEDASSTLLKTLAYGIWGNSRGLEVADTTEIATTVILIPRGRDGYVCRSDILHIRIGQSQHVERIIPFVAWDKHLPSLPTTVHATKRLLALLPSSPGALLLNQQYDEALQEDLKARLSFNWLLFTKPTACRVAVISGRPFPDRKRGIFGSQGYFNAARALGISLVVVDDPGHWLEDDAYRNLRDEFVPVDMDINHLATLPQRLVAALKDKNLDGIVTFWDAYVIATAETAELLGLPTESSMVMRQTHLKHEMRKLINQSNIQAVTIEGEEQLNDPSMAETLGNLRYPLVVKPSRGGTSQSVKKVTDDSSMREAVRAIVRDGFIDPAVSVILLETYVDGPEVDANFVLWDDEVYFLEVTDNFPCAADAADATVADPFRETVQMSNSRLPPDEIEIIRSSLRRSLLKLGFHSGVFHVEARLQNSSMRYRDLNGNGVLDLEVDLELAKDCRDKVDVFLVEINARPPGTGGTWATLFTYGVDQGALHFLRALDDGERFVALSQPYAYPCGSAGDGGGAQYWTAQCLIPIHRDNIHVPDDLWERVYQALPEVQPHVVRAEMYAEPGTVVSIVKSVGWIGYVLLKSRTSRKHALDMYHRLAEACIKVLDQEL